MAATHWLLLLLLAVLSSAADDADIKQLLVRINASHRDRIREMELQVSANMAANERMLMPDSQRHIISEKDRQITADMYASLGVIDAEAWLKSINQKLATIPRDPTGVSRSGSGHPKSTTLWQDLYKLRYFLALVVGALWCAVGFLVGCLGWCARIKKSKAVLLKDPEDGSPLNPALDLRSGDDVVLTGCRGSIQS